MPPAHSSVKALREAKDLEAPTKKQGTILALWVGEDEIIRSERERTGVPVRRMRPGVYEQAVSAARRASTGWRGVLFVYSLRLWKTTAPTS